MNMYPKEYEIRDATQTADNGPVATVRISDNGEEATVKILTRLNLSQWRKLAPLIDKALEEAL